MRIGNVANNSRALVSLHMQRQSMTSFPNVKPSQLSQIFAVKRLHLWGFRL